MVLIKYSNEALSNGFLFSMKKVVDRLRCITPSLSPANIPRTNLGAKTAQHGLFCCIICLVIAVPSTLGQSTNSSPDTTDASHSQNSLDFEAEVWAKVGERTCIRCHTQKGEANTSDFILDNGINGLYDHAALTRNQEAFRSVAIKQSNGQSVLLQKVVGGLEHGGGQVLKPDSMGVKILEQFVLQTLSPSTTSTQQPATTPLGKASFFDGVTMLEPTRLLRRVTLSLAGRLPSPEELQAVESSGLAAIDSILDAILKEEAFYVRLKEGFNDIFLTVGIEYNSETLLS